MKRLSILLITIIILFTSNIAVEAYDVSGDHVVFSDGSKVFYFDDGSRLVITAPKILFEGVDQSKSQQSKTTQASYSFQNTSGETEWIYTLTCTFSYEYGVSSVCTDAHYDQTIYKGNWTFSNGATSISGNRGSGTGLYTEKFLFITIRSINVSLTMACDIYGNVTA